MDRGEHGGGQGVYRGSLEVAGDNSGGQERLGEGRECQGKLIVCGQGWLGTGEGLGKPGVVGGGETRGRRDKLVCDRGPHTIERLA